MAASMIRSCGFRLASHRHNIVGISLAGRVNCSFQEQASHQHISRQFTNQSRGSEIKRNHIVEKVLTDDDVFVHNRICGILLGKKRKSLKKFILNTGIRFSVHATESDHVLVSGKNTDVVKKAVEIVTPHINNIKSEVHSDVAEKVLTDDNEELHFKICGLLIGKGGQNATRLKSDTDHEWKILRSSTIGHVYVIVKGGNAESLKIAVEKVTQEIKRIKKSVKVSD